LTISIAFKVVYKHLSKLSLKLFPIPRGQAAARKLYSAVQFAVQFAERVYTEFKVLFNSAQTHFGTRIIPPCKVEVDKMMSG
jgi:hypothetical protein